MNTLSSTHRKQLERTVADARDVAESGSRAALESLAVHSREAFAHMTQQQRKLRRRLRAHARQLGDRRDVRSGTQAIERLVRECAYEHWHRMLFARFLAENGLLMEPGLGVAVTLDECEELAKDEGIDKWALAARFAQRMLPQVFRPDHPVFEVRLAREHRMKLEGLVEGLPGEVFLASDSLGWVYQFWQARKKAEVNRSEAKVGADELPAVTQLFTEPYMVSFLLDNSLGAWWAARKLTSYDLEKAETEVELRRNASIPGVPLDYLRFFRCEDEAESGGWRVAASAFDEWPEHLGKFKVLDPCCGSGHFLVAVFLMLVPMRMAREGLHAREAVDAVLGDNLYGLELDPRCVELAAFALALTAWTYPGAGGYRSLPELNLACSGLSVGVAKERWTELAAGRHNLRIALNWMYDEFREAPVLGSLLNPAAADAAKLVDWPVLSTVLADALAGEESDERRETAVAARGLVRAAELLSKQYHWVITNVPYLARGKQGESLRRFSERQYPTAKNDLATVFLERCLGLCAEGGTASLVLPQNWLFLTGYRKLREKLLKTQTWRLLARLGEGGFESSAAAGAFVALLTLSRGRPSSGLGGDLLNDSRADGAMYELDVSGSRTAREKADDLLVTEIKSSRQTGQLENPDAVVALNITHNLPLMSVVAHCYQGTSTGDNLRFVRYFWERPISESGYRYFQSSPETTSLHGGKTNIVDWPGTLLFEGSAVRGKEAWVKRGISIGQMRRLPATIFSGGYFSNSTPTIVPHKDCDLPALWCFCSSDEFKASLREINQKLSVDNGYISKIPIDIEQWHEEANVRFPDGLPDAFSSNPTQWIFHGHPCGSVVWDEAGKRMASTPPRTDLVALQVAVARLLGYRWPAERDADMELADEQREWVDNCDTLLAHADEDGIVCIPSVRGESPAEKRLLTLLAAAYGEAWNDGILSKLLAEVGSPNLDDWIRNRFFVQHCRLFHQRPFIWHIWDGRKRDGFHALVNYHKLAEGDGKGRRLLESLTHSYLGDWIRRQQDSVQRGEGGAEGRLAAAFELRKRLVAIAEGEPPSDIFIRWKPVNEQPIGWEPDINDGVRINIRPFMADDIPGGKKGAGILRSKPNIRWSKDRGKEPYSEQEDYPWFWRDGDFIGERVNKLHLTVSQKGEYRNRAEGKKHGHQHGK